MEDEKEDSLRKLIQPVELDKPGDDFTNTIMKLVEAESKLDPAKEAALIQLFQSHTLVEKPSAGFRSRVISQVVISQLKPMEPIIRPGVWYMMAASLLVIVLFCFLLLTSEPTQHTSSGLDRFLSSIEGTLDALPPSYPFTIFAVSALMLIDYYIRRNLDVNY